MKKLLTALVLLSTIAGSAAHATNKRPDIAFILSNKTNHDVTFRGATDCADFPGTIVVKPGERRLIWGEGVKSGTCALLPKGIQLRADRYQFLVDAAAQVTMPTYNGKWMFDISGDGAITLDRQYYQSSDLYLELSVNR